jgi:antibiotic biosynthesis monooxygenase (ABM) superfamily enzyme
MNRLEKIKALDVLFFCLQTHICFENESEQIKLKDQIAKFGKFESLHAAWRKREDRRYWLQRASESEVTIVEADGSEWIQNALEWHIECGRISKKDFELMH